MPAPGIGSAAMASYCYDALAFFTMVRVWLLRSKDLAHGVVEGQAEDLDAEVDGVAGQIAFGPAPVAVFDDEAGIGGQNKLPASRRRVGVRAFASSGASGASRAARICSRVQRGACARPLLSDGSGHSLSSNGVG